MENVKVGDRTGITDGKVMPIGNCYAVWFTGSTKPEFIKCSDVTFLPIDKRTEFQMWRDSQEKK